MDLLADWVPAMIGDIVSLSFDARNSVLSVAVSSRSPAATMVCRSPTLDNLHFVVQLGRNSTVRVIRRTSRGINCQLCTQQTLHVSQH